MLGSRKSPFSIDHHCWTRRCCGEHDDECAWQNRKFDGFIDVESETLMHVAHLFIEAGFESMFYGGTGLDPNWVVPTSLGGQDPYERPRGGTKMKKSNKSLR
eukprot:SAG31_NODE_3034_length_4763_cov_8.243782_3_plen_102_part_00